MGLAGKVALITGAGRGLGRAAALLASSKGAHIVAAARTLNDLESLRHEGGCALAVACDVTDPSQVAALYERIDAAFGRIDVVINNAGIGIFGLIEELSPGDLDALFAVNVKGTFYSCQEAFRRMKAAGGGHIVNVISTSGRIGRAGEAAYTASKWAVTGLTECLKIEGKPHGIRATSFCPGGMETPFWESESGRRHRRGTPRFMPPEEVARVLIGVLELPDGMVVDDLTVRRA